MYTLRNRLTAQLYLKTLQYRRMSQIGELGSGAGKGGGGGGSIREAGGSFGKMEAAREEEYFHKKQKEQLKNLKPNAESKTSEKPKK